MARTLGQQMEANPCAGLYAITADMDFELHYGKRANKRRKMYKDSFFAALFNDLRCPEALAVMWKMLKDNSITEGEKLSLLYSMDKVLGLDLDKIEAKKEEKVGGEEELTDSAFAKFEAVAFKRTDCAFIAVPAISNTLNNPIFNSYLSIST